jgi:PAS domain S-box-containing protein
MKEDDSHDAYHDILRMANDGIVVIQEDRISVANPAFAKMLGYEESKLLGMPFASLLDPVASHLYNEKQEEFRFGQQERAAFRARFMTSEKRVVTAEISTADFVFRGRPAVIALVRDVTHQLELESLLEQSESRYRTMFESSPIACFTLSAHGIIQSLNDAAERLVGFKSEQLLHRSVMSLLPKAKMDAELAKSVLMGAIEGHTIGDAEIKLTTSTGNDVWVSVSSSPLSMEGQSSTIALMALDIQERKIAEERERAQRERANLYLEVTTHDLNNVNQTLLFVIGLMELSPDLPDEIKELMRQSNWNVRKSARMIANLKLLMSLRDNTPPVTKTDANELLQRAIDAVQLDFPWKTIRVNSNVEPEAFYLAANPNIEIVFFNIIHNSANYDQKGLVDIDVVARKDESSGDIRFEFCDRGPGIPDALKESIFKRSGSPDAQTVGRGLGLTLVDTIVRGIGGKVWTEDRAKGRPAEGSKFVVSLPEWKEETILPCGKETCITFYKSDNCLFCEQVYATIIAALDEFSIPVRTVQVVNVDDPNAGVAENDVPMVPLVRICKDRNLTGLVSDDQVRSALLTLVVKSCYPMNRVIHA